MTTTRATAVPEALVELLAETAYVRRKGNGWEFRKTGWPTMFTLDPMAMLLHAEDVAKRVSFGLGAGSLGKNELTLGEWGTDLVERKKLGIGTRKNKKPRPETVAFDERRSRPWREGPLARVPMSLVTSKDAERLLFARAQVAAKSAENEAEMLRAIAAHAERNGAQIDRTLLYVRAPAHEPREGIALGVVETEWLLRFVPDDQRELPELISHTGARCGELYDASDDNYLFDAKSGWHYLHIPAPKEGRPKKLWLLPGPKALLDRAIVKRDARLPLGTTHLIWSRPGGSPWNRHEWRKQVWVGTLKRAHTAWLEEHGCDVSPFMGVDANGKPWFFRMHDLRHTATTRLRDAGVAAEDVALILGHKDKGKLVEERYDHENDDRVRAALAPLGESVYAKVADNERKVVDLASRRKAS